ncbi:hypothetical protein L596_026113 [Steinernema carpocapsae]|uniref:Uncharacterized protein n=1 Tax=Steinernema carpocapsae TaxID=34508 RepID=A0A4U5M0F5_STECR|nr:hypothetical protein L596_026113 [Steinernema carpocapsae]
MTDHRFLMCEIQFACSSHIDVHIRSVDIGQIHSKLAIEATETQLLVQIKKEDKSFEDVQLIRSKLESWKSLQLS